QHLPNLLLTDYLEFRWFVQRDGVSKKEGTARLGSIGPAGKINFDADEQTRALQLIDSFLKQKPIPITSAHDLAVRLAHFTHLIHDIIIEAFANGSASHQLHDWRGAFAATLLPELAVQMDKEEETKAVAEFADMFAQTLAYGLFSARAASPGGKFTREQARKLIPRTNPFLRDFFEQITGTKLGDEPHRVLILDPATGTATFLYRVLDFIREQFERRKNLGAWGDYVHEHLLPRLFGFELLMAPYAVAHFKLGLALAAWDKEPLFRPQWSYEPAKNERINVFLTNTLEDVEERVEQLGPLR